MAMVSGNGKGQGSPSRRGSYIPMSEINVTPMVDVMLVLLVVFMISAYSAVKLDPRDVPWLFQSATSNTDRESHSFSLLWPSQLQYFMALEDV